MATAGNLGELLLIQQIRQRVEASRRAASRIAAGSAAGSAAGPARRRRIALGVELGIGDDCAIVRPPRGHEVLVTTDLCLEGRHFRRDWHTAESVGHRTLARGLSDLAAMGARPMAAFLSLALPATTSERWIAGFLDGLLRLAAQHGVTLAGGDTSEAPGNEIVADVVLVGAAPAGSSLRRSTACVGDNIYVTGWLGGGAAELLELESAAGRRRALGRRQLKSRTLKSAAFAVSEFIRKTDALERSGGNPQMFPEPRLAVGWALRRRELATACMDLSDGLSSDLSKLCEASSVAAEIEVELLPVHPLALRCGSVAASPKRETLSLAVETLTSASQALALNGGEDYELLFTARAEARVPRSIAGVPVTRIGRVVSRRKNQSPVSQIDRLGRRTALPPLGWEHF